MTLVPPARDRATPPAWVLLAAGAAVVVALWFMLHVYTGPWWDRSADRDGKTPPADTVNLDSLVRR